jgi:RNA polymerase sigma factor for flagellar operon FliA
MVELDDMISCGVLGLIDAINSFDLKRKIKFETYCALRIKGAMLDELRRMDNASRKMRSQISSVMKASEKLFCEIGRKPTYDELAEELNFSVTKLEQIMIDINAIEFVSLNKISKNSDNNKNLTEINFIENQKCENVISKIQKNDLKKLITKGFNHDERLIILFYYYETMKMKDIGKILNLSESRVSQMHKDIIKRLQIKLKERYSEFVL